MMRSVTGGAASDINNGSSRVLFIEGEEDSIDVTVLKELIPMNIKPIGPSSYLKSAAKAFRKVHPAHLFLIDRDHQSDDVVEATWTDFEAKKSNLLIWRKKELENYFLNPPFLLLSAFIVEHVSEADLQKRIAELAHKRVYMEIANRVIVNIRESLKEKWIEQFKSVDAFTNADAALQQLLALPDFSAHQSTCNGHLSEDHLKKLFQEEAKLLLGGESELKWGKGAWLDLISGKEILHSLLNDPHYFKNRIPGQTRPCQGSQKIKEVLRRLIRKAVESKSPQLPADFAALRKMLGKRNDDSTTETTERTEPGG